ncbi:MAG: hypothetical protein ACP5O1_11930 [Phycisphaerae bacterium]
MISLAPRAGVGLNGVRGTTNPAAQISRFEQKVAPNISATPMASEAGRIPHNPHEGRIWQLLDGFSMLFAPWI